MGGLLAARSDHVDAVADVALAMRNELARHSVAGFGQLQMRLGSTAAQSWPGVIGRRKFSYDLWSDTVNTAARMERYTTRMRPFGQARANGASVEEDLPNRVVDVNVDHSVWRDVLHADDAVLVLIHDVHT